jgi:hypothetical protein
VLANKSPSKKKFMAFIILTIAIIIEGEGKKKQVTKALVLYLAYWAKHDYFRVGD